MAIKNKVNLVRNCKKYALGNWKPFRTMTLRVNGFIFVLFTRVALTCPINSTLDPRKYNFI